MAGASSSLHFTDDEIWSELRRLGYANISPHQFHIIKEDLTNMILRDQQPTRSSTPSSMESSVLSNSSSTHSAISITLDPEVETRHRSRFQKSLNSASPARSRSSSSNNCLPSNKENQSLNADPSTSGQKMIKRKVLRYVDGQKVITEELRPMPNYKGITNDCSTNSLRNRSSSSEELWQRLSSISLNSKSSSASDKSRTQSRQSGVILPNLNIKRKKCDPVTRYHEYRKYWDTFKLPGENKHSQLRWTVREKMLDYDFS